MNITSLVVAALSLIASGEAPAFVKVDRDTYYIYEEIGKSVSLGVLTRPLGATDWSITFDNSYCKNLPGLTTGFSKRDLEKKTTIFTRFVVDIEIDGVDDVWIEYYHVLDKATRHVRIPSVDPLNQPTWVGVSSFNRQIGEATGLDGTIYVYAPGKGFEPKAK